MACKICGNETENKYCDKCSKKYEYWIERIEDSAEFVIFEGVCYHVRRYVEPWFSDFKGFGGRPFEITYLDGHKEKTNDLWYNGEIPKEVLPLLPDNVANLEEVRC